MTTVTEAAGVLLIDLARASGGTETRVLDTARALRSRGIAVSVVCLDGSPLAVALRREQIPAVGVARVKSDPRLVTNLRRLLRALPGWVVDAHNAQSQLAVHLASMGLRNRGPRLATIHSEYRSSEGSFARFSWHEAVLRLTIRAGWLLVPVSTSVRSNLESLGAPRQRMELIWSGIADPPLPRCRSAVRKELGLGGDDFLVLAVGRLVSVKNYDMAIAAMASIRASVPSARLVIVGDGPERTRLEALAAHAGPPGAVRFLGSRSDVRDLLAASDVLAITSTTEGLPYVVLEAAAAHTPIVSTSVGSMAEVFGETVALLPPGVERQPHGVALLGRTISSLARDPQRRLTMASGAAAIQQRHLSLDSMMSATVSAYSLGADRRTAESASS